MLVQRTTKDFWKDHHDSIDEALFPEELKGYLRDEENKIVQFCQKTNPDTVLEAGCGKGRIIKRILPYCGKIAGIDYSPTMVRFCSERHRNNPNVRIYEEDITQTHFPAEHFDLEILAFNTLGNTDTNKEKALFELKRILKPTGSLLISVYSDKARDVQYKTYNRLGLNILKEENNRIYTREGLISQRFSKADLEAWLQICGFKGKIEPLLDIAYFIVAQKEV